MLPLLHNQGLKLQSTDLPLQPSSLEKKKKKSSERKIIFFVGLYVPEPPPPFRLFFLVFVSKRGEVEGPKEMSELRMSTANEWFGLEGTSRGHLSRGPGQRDAGQRHHSPEKATGHQ